MCSSISKSRECYDTGTLQTAKVLFWFPYKYVRPPTLVLQFPGWCRIYAGGFGHAQKIPHRHRRGDFGVSRLRRSPAGRRARRALCIDCGAGSRIFGAGKDFHKWEAWSPWAKLDPAAKTTFEGPVSGKGASFSWAGNSEVGEGKMTIVESDPSDHIKINLDF